MMLTIETAGVTWCPMVRIASMETLPAREHDGPDGDELVDAEDVLAAGCNTGALGLSRVPASCRCIASRCAMWRWAEPAGKLRDRRTRWPDDELPVSEPSRPVDLPTTWAWIPLTGEGDDLEGGYWVESAADLEAEHARVIGERRGYCGLAGAPAVIGG